MKPGDEIILSPITSVEARELAIDIRNAILNANPLQETAMKV